MVWALLLLLLGLHGVRGAGNGTSVAELERSLAQLDARLRAGAAAARPPARYALLVAGRYGPWSKAASQGVLRSFASSLRQMRFAAASHATHVVGAAANLEAAPDGAVGVDVFVHSWNPEAAAFIDAQYASALIASLHQPLEELHEAARSFALSIGRVARLARAHEHERGRAYEMLLLVRCDLTLVADVPLPSLGMGRIWLASHCCKRKAATAEERALVDRTCGLPFAPRPQPPPQRGQRLPAGVGSAVLPLTHYQRALSQWEHHFYGHAFLTPCRASAYLPAPSGGAGGLRAEVDSAFFSMDWWVATSQSDLLASWEAIGTHWPSYACALRRRGFVSGRLYSHFAWAVHIHDVLRATERLGFSDAVTGSLARLVSDAAGGGGGGADGGSGKARWTGHAPVPALSAGACISLTVAGRELVGAQLSAQPLGPAEAAAVLGGSLQQLGAREDSLQQLRRGGGGSGGGGGGGEGEAVWLRFGPMARQCPLAAVLAGGGNASGAAPRHAAGASGGASGIVCCADGICGDRSLPAAEVEKPSSAAGREAAVAFRVRAAGACASREGRTTVRALLAAAPPALESETVRMLLLSPRPPTGAQRRGSELLAAAAAAARQDGGGEGGWVGAPAGKANLRRLGCDLPPVAPAQPDATAAGALAAAASAAVADTATAETGPPAQTPRSGLDAASVARGRRYGPRPGGGVPGSVHRAAHASRLPRVRQPGEAAEEAGAGGGPRANKRAKRPPSAAAGAPGPRQLQHAGADAPTVACVPPAPERRYAKHYGFGGVHYVRQLHAWLYEVPKSGSTTLVSFFRLRNGARDAVAAAAGAAGRRAAGPAIGFVVARHPVERAISAFHTAFERAAWRTNETGSACAFARFPFLQAGISDSDGLVSAVRVLAQHGTALADAGCGFAYHHLLSQSWFIWRERTRLLYGAGLPRGQRPTDAELPPAVSVVLRLEHLADDLLALCASRNATAFCAKRIRQLGGIRPLNPSRKAAISKEAWAQAQAYYAPDFECLGYPLGYPR